MASIQTVTGPMAADALGRTLAHEHIWCDLTGHSGREDNRVTDAARSIAELAHFHAAGGGAIIELTPEGIGRNPARLREISLASLLYE